MMIGMTEGVTTGRDHVRDQRIERAVPLVTPERLLGEMPLGPERAKAVVHGREQVSAVLDGEDDRLLVIVGPCSVHDVDAAMEYARRLAKVSERLGDDLALGVGGEVHLERLAVDRDLAGAGHQPGAGDGFLAAAGGLGERSNHLRLRSWVQRAIVSGLGACAACGWSGPAYTFSLLIWARPSGPLGSMPLIVRRTASAGRRSSASP